MHTTRTTARQQRALRAAAATGVSTFIAAAAHTLAGAGAPPWWLLTAAALLAWPPAVWLVGRRLSLTGTSAAVLAAQGLLHVMFAAVGTGAPQSSAGHHLVVSGATMRLAAGGHVHLDAGMITAHLVAAVVTVVLLTRGERVIRRLARGVRRVLARADLAPVSLQPFVVAVGAAPAAPTSRPFLSVLSRRGPPALAR